MNDHLLQTNNRDGANGYASLGKFILQLSQNKFLNRNKWLSLLDTLLVQSSDFRSESRQNQKLFAVNFGRRTERSVFFGCLWFERNTPFSSREMLLLLVVSVQNSLCSHEGALHWNMLSLGLFGFSLWYFWFWCLWLGWMCELLGFCTNANMYVKMKN